MTALTLRSATKEDAKLVFEWRNDPWIIQKGSLNKTVSWEEHEAWFTALVDDPLRHMFIIEVDGISAGQVRFITMDNQNMAEVSIYLMQGFINKGLGVQALKQACREIKTYLNINHIIAYILENNTHSEKAFQKAGFVESKNYQDIDVPSRENHLVYALEV